MIQNLTLTLDDTQYRLLTTRAGQAAETDTGYALGGVLLRCNLPERTRRVLAMHSRGLSDAAMAETIGCVVLDVKQIRAALGLPANRRHTKS